MKYDDDFSGHHYYAAQEAAIKPIYVLMLEFPKRFRRWIESLKYNGKTKPLDGFINKNTRYINFNYTEFVESTGILVGIAYREFVKMEKGAYSMLIRK